MGGAKIISRRFRGWHLDVEARGHIEPRWPRGSSGWLERDPPSPGPSGNRFEFLNCFLCHGIPLSLYNGTHYKGAVTQKYFDCLVDYRIMYVSWLGDKLTGTVSGQKREDW